MRIRGFGQVFSYCVACKKECLHEQETKQSSFCNCYKGAKWIEGFVMELFRKN